MAAFQAALKELTFNDLRAFFSALVAVIKYVFDKETGLADETTEA